MTILLGTDQCYNSNIKTGSVIKGNYIPKLHATLALQILNPARTAEIKITFMNIAIEENVFDLSVFNYIHAKYVQWRISVCRGSPPAIVKIGQENYGGSTRPYYFHVSCSPRVSGFATGASYVITRQSSACERGKI